jgi:CheY-like chemotaxis protein
MAVVESCPFQVYYFVKGTGFDPGVAWCELRAVGSQFHELRMKRPHEQDGSQLVVLGRHPSKTFLHQKSSMSSVATSSPAVFVINDDQSLLESRRRLLEACGATVVTACGEIMAIQEAMEQDADLILIDATNVGLEHGEKICDIIRKIRPGQLIGLLVQPEIGTPPVTSADRVIARTGPRRILVEANEMLEGRLSVDLWRDGIA